MRIAISGHSGCGNTTATVNVGRGLSLDVVNFTFRNLATELSLSFEELHKEASLDHVYDYLTDLFLIRSSLKGNVVVGTRLAAWLIEADLRIWLHAPLEIRASRISGREKTQEEDPNHYERTLYQTLKRDKQNRKRYLRLYGIDIDDHSDFDITVNTAKLSSDQVSSLIIEAAKWAEKNNLERKNNHLEHIQRIIAKNLFLPLEALRDPDFSLNIKEIYAKIHRR